MNSENDSNALGKVIDESGIDVEHFRKAIEIVSQAFEYCEQLELQHMEVHVAFLFLTLGSIYETLENVEAASTFVNSVKQLTEGSYRMSAYEDIPDDLRVIVDKFLGVYLREFKTIH